MFKRMAALAALLVALPAAAQIQVTPYNGVNAIGVTGTLTTAGDTVTMDVSGGQWATVVWNVVGTAGTAGGIVTEISSDNRVNWTAAPGNRRLSTVTANPSVSFLGAPLSTGQIWETPLPANATSFRVRAANTGTTTTIQIQGGAPYVPNMPVVALLYDTSVTAGANNNTGTIDVTGWRYVTVSIVQTTAATGAASLNIVDEAGAAIPVGTSASIAVGTYVFGWGDVGSFGAANPFTISGGAASLPLDRRFNVAVAGATTSATRIRIAARR
jgi:hypothetical protein